jgi:hypothetical protein
MAKFNGYKFTPRSINVYPEIWDAEKKQLNAIKDMENFTISEVLDSIVLAVEAGTVDNYLWPQQIFANRKSFESFIEQLSEYDDCYRITDQWWQALSELVEYGDEEGFVSSSEIADKLFDAASEDGKLENFGRKKPKYKFSVKECIDARLACATDEGTGHPYCFFASADERSRVREIALFGRYYSETAASELITAAYRKGESIGEIRRAEEKAAAKAAKGATKKPPAKKITKK